MESGVGDRQALRKVRLTKAVQHRSPQRRHANPGDQLVRIISDQVALDSSVADGAILTRAHREVHDAGQPVGHLQSVDQSSRERRERPFWMLAGHRADQMHRTGPLRKRLEVRGPRIVAPRNLDRLSGDASARERTRLSPPAREREPRLRLRGIQEPLSSFPATPTHTRPPLMDTVAEKRRTSLKQGCHRHLTPQLGGIRERFDGFL